MATTGKDMQNHNQHMYVLLYHERNTFVIFFGSPLSGMNNLLLLFPSERIFLLTNTCFTIGI